MIDDDSAGGPDVEYALFRYKTRRGAEDAHQLPAYGTKVRIITFSNITSHYRFIDIDIAGLLLFAENLERIHPTI